MINLYSFGAEYYFKSNNTFEPYHNGSSILVKSTIDANFGASFKENEIFTFLGGKVKPSIEHTIDGSGNLGFNFKKKLSDNIGIILNTGYEYNEGYEDNIKEIIKLRGEWDSRFEKDKKLLKEYYHTQGLRFKGKENLLLSSIVNYDDDKVKGYSGVIYSSEGFNI